ncbi:MAG: hypothetical protein WBF88_14830, partial [Pusillimonas sp.]
ARGVAREAGAAPATPDFLKYEPWSKYQSDFLKYEPWSKYQSDFLKNEAWSKHQSARNRTATSA